MSKDDPFDFESMAQPYPETDPEPPEKGWTYHVTPQEIREYHKWMREHHKEHHKGKIPYAGAIGGAYTMTFTSTSLGGITGVECGLCRASGKDKTEYMHCLTDFSDW